MREKRFLLYPVFFIVLVIFLDKIFLLEFFQERFLQKGNPVFYLHRKLLFGELKNNPAISEGTKKLALVLGDSRSYPFANVGLSVSDQKIWDIYNFSGPQAVPMYSLYWLERILEAGINPRMIVLSLSPEAFDDSKGMIYDPFLRLGSDEKFRTKYWDRIPFEDRYSFYMDRLFVFRSIQFDYKLFFNRLKSKTFHEYHPDTNEDMMILKMGKGEYLAYGAFANVDSKLKKDAIRIQGIYLNKFSLDETQFFFVEKIMELAKKNNSRLVVVWPRVYKEYRKYYYDLDLESRWWNRIETMAKRYDAVPMNFNDDRVGTCDLFNDASHQSVHCFQKIIPRVFTHGKMEETKNQPK